MVTLLLQFVEENIFTDDPRTVSGVRCVCMCVFRCFLNNQPWENGQFVQLYKYIVIVFYTTADVVNRKYMYQKKKKKNDDHVKADFHFILLLFSSWCTRRKPWSCHYIKSNVCFVLFKTLIRKLYDLIRLNRKKKKKEIKVFRQQSKMVPKVIFQIQTLMIIIFNNYNYYYFYYAQTYTCIVRHSPLKHFSIK